MKEELKILFLGTPDFAVASLQMLVENNCNVVGVVTAPDKPAGRGLELHESPVKKYAKAKGIKLFQPKNLKDPEFLKEIKAENADLQIVVAFRMMPEALWNMPRLGTFNLHASLLPQYRGAAPINHAILNGEKETGVTTFFLRHEIDTGDIIFTEKVMIGENETAGELHDKLMATGALLVLKTVQAIASGTVKTIPQANTLSAIKFAPKIFKDDCKINWNSTCGAIHNKIRGLCPYPASYTDLISEKGEVLVLKIFKSEKEITDKPATTGQLNSDSKTYIKISCLDGIISVKELQLQGKKRMGVEEFLRGFKIHGWNVKN
jgi:methionyl-tRNA formyltransferase